MSDPIILSTWRFGRKANEAGWPHLVRDGGSSLEAVEQACRAIEADVEVDSVGRGGYPDRSGQVTLDASIMLSPSQCGSVSCVRQCQHPVSLARLVMEHSPHVMLTADGADAFARRHGMPPAELLTEPIRAAWQKWRAEQTADESGNGDAESGSWPGKEVEKLLRGGVVPANFEERGRQSEAEDRPCNRAHDTVGVLALDGRGQLAGACSTSGMPLKSPGRVGDSPIIGHGLYVHPRYGAAVATGLGELIMGVCGTFLAVEMLRQGASPAEAAAAVLQRILESFVLHEEHQAAIIVLDPSGRWSSASLRPGYHTAVRTATRNEVVDPDRIMLS